MMQLQRLLRPVWSAVLVSLGVAAAAQQPAVRLAGPISNASKTVLAGSRSPHATAGNDLGALDPSTAIHGMTLVFSRTPAQETALQSLLAVQQNPASPQFHQWLTPEQFGTQFGVADADLAKVQAWLTGQGFTDLAVSRSRNSMDFSGTAAQVNAAFGTEMHQYRGSVPTGSNTPHADYAPSTDLSLPAALVPLVITVQHVSTFRPRPQIRLGKPEYTSSVSGSHFLTPPDIATQYDVSPVYNSGFNGAGQSIAVIGQTFIPVADIQHFQTAAGLPNNPPTLFLMPGTGTSAIYQGDEGESDLDVEYSLGMARGANVILVYTGSSPNFGVFNAAQYAIQNDIAPIITLSYSGCELGFTGSELSAYAGFVDQATAQGQSFITAAGDSGSTSCFGETGLSLAQQEAPAVGVFSDVPAVTGIGGLQMQAGTFATGNTTYFAAASGTDNISSLLSYVPETVWNEDSTIGLSSGGGGVSTFYARPTWQTGVPGIPAGGFRLVPDISLQASTASPGFLFCTSDASSWQTGQVGSCTNGFRDAGNLLTVAGGTSFSAPIFAGMLAVLNQAKNIPRQGTINPILYGLAGNATTYASAFHDITTGTNACTVADATLCSAAGASAFTAGVGYDEASGLGSIDFAHLVAVWPNGTGSTLAATTTALTATTLTPAANATDAITVTVAPANGGTPTGSVTFVVDTGSTQTGGLTTTVALTNGQASFTYPGSANGGSHIVTATYSGDITFAPSVGSITLTLAGTALPTGSFTIAATPLNVPQNSTGTSTITVTPSGGYVGQPNFTITTTLPANTCYAISIPNPTNSTTLPFPIPAYTLTFGSGATVCANGLVQKGPAGAQVIRGSGKAANSAVPQRPWKSERTGATILAGLMGVGLLTRRRTRRLPALLALAGLSLVVTLGISGCGGTSANTVVPPTNTGPAGTYQLTLVGTDSVTANITSSTTFTLTLQ